MNVFTRVVAWSGRRRSRPKSSRLSKKAVRLHDEMETTRLSQRSLAGSNYEIRRASDPDNY